MKRFGTLLLLCSASVLGAGAKQTIILAGTSSLRPLIAAWAGEYSKSRRDIAVSLPAEREGVEPVSLLGRADLAMLDRRVWVLDDEQEIILVPSAGTPSWR